LTKYSEKENLSQNKTVFDVFCKFQFNSMVLLKKGKSGCHPFEEAKSGYDFKVKKLTYISSSALFFTLF